ncbi:MAG: hypothetical protein ACYC1F_05230 [Gallionellaceae bacterium]
MANFPTLSCSPSFPLDPDGEIEDVVLRSPFEGGYEQTRPRSTRTRRTFGLNYKALNNADVALLRAFEITTLRNGADSFTWTHPLSATSYTVRLTGPIKFAKQQVSTHSAVALTLREV